MRSGAVWCGSWVTDQRTDAVARPPAAQAGVSGKIELSSPSTKSKTIFAPSAVQAAALGRPKRNPRSRRRRPFSSTNNFTRLLLLVDTADN